MDPPDQDRQLRILPPARQPIHAHDSGHVQQPRFPAQAWLRRVQSGQAGNAMMGGLTQLGAKRATELFGDWTTRIAHGELPAEAPPRPQGIERNVVITQWDWADPKAYLHDEISTDKRNPNCQRQRPDLRIARGKPRLSAGARSGAQHHQPGEGSLSRSEHARAAEAAAAVADLGRRSDLGQPHHGSQSDVR